MNMTRKILTTFLGLISVVAVCALAPSSASASSQQFKDAQRYSRVVEKLPARYDGKSLSDPTVERYVSRKLNRGKVTARASVFPGFRQVLKVALRHGGDTLGRLLGRLSPRVGGLVQRYSGQAANAMDSAEAFVEGPITVALMRQGVPADVAADIAKALITLAA